MAKDGSLGDNIETINARLALPQEGLYGRDETQHCPIKILLLAINIKDIRIYYVVFFAKEIQLKMELCKLVNKPCFYSTITEHHMIASEPECYG